MLKFVEDGAEAKSFLNFQGVCPMRVISTALLILLTEAYSLLQYMIQIENANEGRYSA